MAIFDLYIKWLDRVIKHKIKICNFKEKLKNRGLPPLFYKGWLRNIGRRAFLYMEMRYATLALSASEISPIKSEQPSYEDIQVVKKSILRIF